MNIFGVHVCMDEVNMFLSTIPHFHAVYLWGLRILSL